MYNTYKHHPKGSYVHLYGLDGMFMFTKLSPPEERDRKNGPSCLYVIRCNMATKYYGFYFAFRDGKRQIKDGLSAYQ